MRKVTQNAVNAFNSNKSGNFGNTEVSFQAMRIDGQFPKGDHFLTLKLFGKEIAARDSGDGSLYITNAGWPTNTTKDRLNALDGVSISQKKGVWYLNGEEWNGKWTKVTQ